MAVDYTVDALIADIKRHGSLPSSQTLLSDDDIAKMMDHCQRQVIIPGIMRTREENFVHPVEIALTGVDAPAQADANNPSFAIPSRSIGGKVRSVSVLDASNNESLLARIEPENKRWHNSNSQWPNSLAGYRFQGNNIVLTPDVPGSWQTLLVRIFRRPNALVLSEECAKIASINTTSGVLTLESTPEDWATGLKFDLISGQPNFQSFSDSEEASDVNVSANTVTVSVETAALLSAGDWVCVEKQTCVPQYAEEFASLLVNYTLEDVLKSIGDLQGAAAVAADREDLMQMLYQTGANRDEGSPRKIVSRRGIFDSEGW